MNERQFWNFAGLQPLAEKPWVTFMGRQVRVPDMPGGPRSVSAFTIRNGRASCSAATWLLAGGRAFGRRPHGRGFNNACR